MSIDIKILQKNSPWKNEMHFFETIDSTNNVALELGESGAAEGTMVIADVQTEGRGQFRRPWSSPAGMGLWMSLLLRLPITQQTIPSLSRFATVALCDAFEKSNIPMDHVRIKKPNDLLINEKKVAGVLVETRIGKSPFAVVGIGVNLYQQREDFFEELREKATSLAMAMPTLRINRHELAVTFIEALYQRYQQLLKNSLVLDDAWYLRLSSKDE